MIFVACNGGPGFGPIDRSRRRVCIVFNDDERKKERKRERDRGREREGENESD